MENFYDVEKVRNHQPHTCWSCKESIRLPPRIRIGQATVMLNYDTRLFPHHLGALYDFSAQIAAVSRHPRDPSVWGLTNHSQETWTVTRPDGALSELPPGRSVTLASGVKINFGTVEGEIRW